ncbi:MAG TPA: RraA family protein, partial [Phycisphaerae bacterium]|nr:RraA family protein [Phycisphaerae bacterium]
MPSREELLEAFDSLRVADVCDAMDMCGLMGRGLLSREIRPLFRDVDGFAHCFRGLAKTVRYMPTNRPVPTVSPREWPDYIEDWRKNISPGFGGIQPGDAIVMDAADQDVGFIGSGNSLGWRIAGAVKAVT